jgi:capsular exopolysaccharide synthesis family protein
MGTAAAQVLGSGPFASGSRAPIKRGSSRPHSRPALILTAAPKAMASTVDRAQLSASAAAGVARPLRQRPGEGGPSLFVTYSWSGSVDLHEYVRLLRRRWRVIVVVTLSVVAAAALVTATADQTYRAQAKLFVSTQGDNDTVSGVYQGGLLAQQRVKSYVDLIQGRRVAERVIQKLELSMSPEELRKKVDASAPLDTVLLKVAVRDASPRQAKRLTDAIADSFVEFVTEVEQPDDGGRPPVKVSVVERAEIPQTPLSPRPSLNIALGVVLGLALGLAGAIARELLDSSISGRLALSETVGAPLIGTIALDPQAGDRPLVVAAEPLSPQAEAYRHIRTGVQFVCVDRAVTSIVLTSALAAEGKSTVSANLAVAMAQLGQRVILVETDLRRPSLALMMGLEGAIGLTDVLVGRVSLDDAVQSWGMDSLEVLLAGTIPPNPSELLASAAMAKVIRELEAKADLVIFDAPPLLPVTDAAVLATRAGGAVLVARAGSTKRDQVKQAAESLRAVGADLLGAIFTFDKTTRPDAGYYYTYSAATAKAKPFVPKVVEKTKSSRSPVSESDEAGPGSPEPNLAPSGQTIPSDVKSPAAVPDSSVPAASGSAPVSGPSMSPDPDVSPSDGEGQPAEGARSSFFAALVEEEDETVDGDVSPVADSPLASTSEVGAGEPRAIEQYSSPNQGEERPESDGHPAASSTNEEIPAGSGGHPSPAPYSEESLAPLDEDDFDYRVELALALLRSKAAAEVRAEENRLNGRGEGERGEGDGPSRDREDPTDPAAQVRD